MDVNELLAIAQSRVTLLDENTEELRDTLLSLLPPLKDFKIENINGSTENFVAEFSADIFVYVSFHSLISLMSCLHVL